MNYIEKASEIIDSVIFIVPKKNIKSVCILIIKNEYKSNREILFNLKSTHTIESDKVYLHRLEQLITEENLIIEEIKNTKL